MELQVKLRKTADITYLEGNKEQEMRCLILYKIRINKKGTIDVFKGKGEHER